MPRKARALTDEELLSAIDAAEQSAIGANATNIATDRADAIARYLGKAYTGDMAAPPGRSSVTSRDVADTIDGVLANVIKPFAGGEEIVKFNPLGPDDEDRAQQETDYVNLIALERNNGFLWLTACIKDALLVRNGYAKCYWFKRGDIIIEKYEGLSEEELAMIAADADVEIVGHNEYPDPMQAMAQQVPAQGIPGMPMPPAPAMLHDLKLRRKRPTEYVKIDPLPPEEILVSQRQRSVSLQECDFVQHRTHKTLSELRQMGYDVEDDITDDDSVETQEDYARQRTQTGSMFEDETQDMARRIVLFKETWLLVDRDGDGIAELRRVCQVGKVLLDDEEADIIPIAAFCPTLMPHQHQGVSVYDQIEDLARLKTALLRQFMDNKYLANNSRVFVNQNVNVDDLLTSRPGGVVRVEGMAPVSEAALPWVVPDTGPSALQGLEYLDTVRENRTGYTRQTQGLSNDALSTATLGGQMLQLSQSQLRLEMIARMCGETGVRDASVIIHALTLKHSTRAEKIRIRGKWIDIDPREWVRRTDLSISVGIGAASQQTMLAGLTLIGQAQEKLMPMGLVKPDNAFNLAKKLTNAVGFRNTEEFFSQPQMTPNPQTGKMESQMPPPPPPEGVLVEQERGKTAQAIAGIKAQHDKMMADWQAMLDQKKLELEHEVEVIRQQGALALQQSNDQRQSALDQQKAVLDDGKHARESDVKWQIANLQAATTIQVAQIGAGLDDGSRLKEAEAHAAGFKALIDGLSKAVEALSAPKEIVRDPSGRAIGVQSKTVQ